MAVLLTATRRGRWDGGARAFLCACTAASLKAIVGRACPVELRRSWGLECCTAGVIRSTCRILLIRLSSVNVEC